MKTSKLQLLLIGMVIFAPVLTYAQPIPRTLEYSIPLPFNLGPGIPEDPESPYDSVEEVYQTNSIVLPQFDPVWGEFVSAGIEVIWYPGSMQLEHDPDWNNGYGVGGVGYEAFYGVQIVSSMFGDGVGGSGVFTPGVTMAPVLFENVELTYPYSTSTIIGTNIVNFIILAKGIGAPWGYNHFLGAQFSGDFIWRYNYKVYPGKAAYLNTGTNPPFSDRLKIVPSYAENDTIGYISTVTGNATITHPGGSPQIITGGQDVYFNDIIETDPGAQVEIVFYDDSEFDPNTESYHSSFVVGGNANLAIDEYVYDPDPNPSPSKIQLLRSLFLFTSGLIGGGDDNVPESTPNGVLGIRADATGVDPLLLDRAVTLRAASPVSLYTAVQSPTNAFEFSFDYGFMDESGLLEVTLDRINLFSVNSSSNRVGILYHHSQIVTNPGVLNLTLAKLRFRYDGNPGTVMFLDNVVFPGLTNGNFSQFDGNWFSEGHGAVELAGSLAVCSELTSLSARQDGANIVLSWPTTATNYILEATSTPFIGTNWLTVTNPVGTDSGQFVVTNAMETNPRFFRLRMVCP